MKVQLAYGRNGLEIDLPDCDVTIIEPTYIPGLADEQQALVKALHNPLEAPQLGLLAQGSQRVAIVFSDITRAVPTKRLLPPILDELAQAGVRKEQIVLLNATGLHRPNTEAELAQMLGDEVVRTYQIVNHDACDDEHLRRVGRTSRGNDVWLNRAYVEADLRILTGFTEPHFFAGFSGGAKSILPGIAGESTILRNHNAAMLADSRATWGTVTGNPVVMEAREAAQLAPPSFVVNVTTNRLNEITGIFAGELIAVHETACRFARETAMQSISQPFDIVVTTNSGYPLDLNLYQAVKGICAASRIVRPGGAIVMAAECKEGMGHGGFAEILKLKLSPEELLELIMHSGSVMIDQWQVQLLAQVLTRAQVYLFSHGLSSEEIRGVHLQPSRDLAATLCDLVAKNGPTTRIGVMPEGPQTIPYVLDSGSNGG